MFYSSVLYSSTDLTLSGLSSNDWNLNNVTDPLQNFSFQSIVQSFSRLWLSFYSLESYSDGRRSKGSIGQHVDIHLNKKILGSHYLFRRYSDTSDDDY